MKALIIITTLFSLSVFGEYSSQSEFNQVLQKYELLHQAFFDNNLKAVKKNAKNVLKGIESIKDRKIAETLSYTKRKLEDIIDSEDIEKSKKDMHIISQGLLVVIEKYAPNKKYARFYCPMVQKYWIQNISESDKVMNPYASNSMPHCGEKKPLSLGR